MTRLIAELDDNNMVTRSIMSDDISWAEKNLGGRWVDATGKNGYPGCVYIEATNDFIPPRPVPWLRLKENEWMFPPRQGVFRLDKYLHANNISLKVESDSFFTIPNPCSSRIWRFGTEEEYYLFIVTSSFVALLFSNEEFTTTLHYIDINIPLRSQLFFNKDNGTLFCDNEAVYSLPLPISKEYDCFIVECLGEEIEDGSYH